MRQEDVQHKQINKEDTGSGRCTCHCIKEEENKKERKKLAKSGRHFSTSMISRVCAVDISVVTVQQGCNDTTMLAAGTLTPCVSECAVNVERR